MSDENKPETPFTTQLQDIRRKSEEYAEARHAHETARQGELAPLMRFRDWLETTRRDLYRDTKP